jgi:hypothetical protein
MSDGTELGMTYNSVEKQWLADESPSNGGAIIQISKASPLPDPGAVWNDGDSAFVRGASYKGGSLIKLYLCIFKSITGSGIIYVGWTAKLTEATRFRAVQVAGTRVSWHAELGGGSYFGIRLGEGNTQLEVDTSALSLPLACQFERVEYLPTVITVP